MRNLLLSLMLLYLAKGTSLAQNCSINAGLSTTICLSDTIKLFGTRSGLFSANATSRWMQISGPVNVSINHPDSLITTVSGYTPGNYIFKLTNKCQDGIVSEDSISIKVLPLTAASAGKDLVLCPSVTYYLEGNKPLNENETGEWSIVSTNNGVTITAPSNPNSPIILQPTISGITKLRWTIRNSNGCVSYDDMEITNCGGVMPVNAGPDQKLDKCYGTTTCAILSAANGGTGYNNQIGKWSLVSGPSIPVMNFPNNPSTTVCNLNQGTYVFRYTVQGPCANGFDDVAITVPPATTSLPYANANASGAITDICNGSSSITLFGNTPTSVEETVQWIKTSGPVTVNILSPNKPTSMVTGFTKPGVYTFKYVVTNVNSGCSGFNEVRYELFESGTVDAGQDQVLPCNVTEVTITPVTTGYGNVSYRIINGPRGAINYPTPFTIWHLYAPYTIRGLNYPGTYTIETKYSFGNECPSVSDFVNVTVSRTPTNANAGSSQNFTCSSNYTQLAGNNPALTGFGAGRWSQVSGPNPALFINPDNYICNVKGTIQGTYTFRWTINAGNNCPDNHDDIVVITPDSSVSAANAGQDKLVCYNSPVTLQGNFVRTDESVKWIVTPSEGVRFYPSNTISNPTVDGLSPNTTYTFEYTIMNSCGSVSTDAVNITTSASSGPSVADAGNNQCLPLGIANVQLNARLPQNGTGNWVQIEGSPSTIINPSLHNTSVLNIANGTSKFVWTVAVEGCSNDSKDTVTITVSGNTSVANAGSDITKCGSSQQLNGNTPQYGNGYWSQISGDGNAVIEQIDNPVTNVSNLTTGLYTFRWTIQNGACSANYDDVVLNISTPPSVADAGPDQTLCGDIKSTLLNAAAPASGTGQWVVLTSSSGNPVLTNSTSSKTNVTGLNGGVYTFRWIVSGGPNCPQSVDDITVHVSPVANAGADQSLCNLSSARLKGNLSSIGTWSQLSGPNTTIIQTSPGNPVANVTGLQSGASYTYRYTIPSFAGCPATYDDVVVKNGTSTLIPDAGNDESFCNGTSFQLSGNKPGTGETGIWSVESGPAGAIIQPNANNPNAVLSGVSAGIYILKWTISNGTCTSSDIKRIDNYISPTKADAGADDTLCFTNVISLNANTPSTGIGKWSLISGPNTPVIDAPNNPASRVIGVVPGTYTFLWTVSNYTCASSVDEVQVTVLNNINRAFAGYDVNTCLNSIMLNGNVPADGNKCKWLQLSGPNAAKFSSAESAQCTISNLQPGCYKFLWKIYNARCYSIDTIEIKVNNSVKVDAGNDFTLCNTISSIPLSGASVSGYTNEGNWTIISGEGTLSTESKTSNPGSVVFTPAPGYRGIVVLRLSANDNCHTVTDDMAITIKDAGKNMEVENDTTRTDPNTSVYIGVLKNDKIMGNTILTLCNSSIAVRPAHGSAIVNNDGTISYTPATGFTGIDSFNYKLCNTAIMDSFKDICVTEGNDNAWVYVTIEGCIIPNSFSPDGDGVNDFFEIPCAQGSSKINIFNRAGIEVYKNDAYNNEWDGNYNGSPLPDGTYFYMLKYSTDTVNKLSKDGFITLRR